MKICIDAGHGGKDPGAVNTAHQYLPEKTIALKVAELLAEDLKCAGHTVQLTRNRDIFVELQERCNISNRFGADLFVSIHCNAAESTQAAGFEVLHAVNSSKGKKAATLILNQFALEFPTMKNRGLMPSKSTRYPRWIRVLHKTNAPSVLIELGFISNKVEGAFIQKPENWKRFSRSIVKAIQDFF